MEEKYSVSRTRALRIVSKRSISAAEIKKRLIDKGDSEDVADFTVNWLKELGLINDLEYSHSIVRHYSEKGYGPARVRDELFKRGIPRDMWDDVLESELNDSDIESAANVFLEKKLKGSLEENDLNRASNALVRRGFSYDNARHAISRYIEKNKANHNEP